MKYAVADDDKVMGYALRRRGFLGAWRYKGSLILTSEGDIYRIRGLQPKNIKVGEELEVELFGDISKSASFLKNCEWAPVM